MTRLFFLLLISPLFIVGCQSSDTKNRQYYDNFFTFSNESPYDIVYVFVPQGCYSCNHEYYNNLKYKTLEKNEYCLILSHYPYCESEREITTVLKRKFGSRFAIDSTNLHLQYKEVPTYSKTVILQKTHRKRF